MKLTEIQAIIKPLTRYLEKYQEYKYTVMKWQPEDVIKNFSDLDIFIVIDTTDIDLLIKIDSDFIQLYKEMINGSVANARCLEHTPYLITSEEIRCGFGYRNQIVTWSLLHGDDKAYTSDIKPYQLLPYDDDDNTYYLSIINSKDKYDLKDELIYTHHPKEVFTRYCLCWRYYATSLYAIASILEHKRIIGKRAALRRVSSLFPGMKYSTYKDLIEVINSYQGSENQLMHELRDDISIAKQALTDDTSKIKINLPNSINITRKFARAVYIIRNKVSRMSLYLSQEYDSLRLPESFIKNLIQREIDDMVMLSGVVKETLQYLKLSNNNNLGNLNILSEKLDAQVEQLSPNSRDSFQLIHDHCKFAIKQYNQTSIDLINSLCVHGQR